MSNDKSDERKYLKTAASMPILSKRTTAYEAHQKNGGNAEDVDGDVSAVTGSSSRQPLSKAMSSFQVGEKAANTSAKLARDDVQQNAARIQK